LIRTPFAPRPAKDPRLGAEAGRSGDESARVPKGGLRDRASRLVEPVPCNFRDGDGPGSNWVSVIFRRGWIAGGMGVHHWARGPRAPILPARKIEDTHLFSPLSLPARRKRLDVKVEATAQEGTFWTTGGEGTQGLYLPGGNRRHPLVRGLGVADTHLLRTRTGIAGTPKFLEIGEEIADTH